MISNKELETMENFQITAIDAKGLPLSMSSLYANEISDKPSPYLITDRGGFLK